jgi:hypothetical protein
VVTAHEDDQLVAAYEKFEAEEMGQGMHEKCVSAANELAQRCGVLQTWGKVEASDRN